jgi:hypothetical protein
MAHLRCAATWFVVWVLVCLAVLNMFPPRVGEKPSDPGINSLATRSLPPPPAINDHLESMIKEEEPAEDEEFETPSLSSIPETNPLREKGQSEPLPIPENAAPDLQIPRAGEVAYMCPLVDAKEKDFLSQLSNNTPNSREPTAAEGPKPVKPSGKIGAQAADPPVKAEPEEVVRQPVALPDWMDQLPMVAMIMPTPHQTVEEAAKETLSPDIGPSPDPSTTSTVKGKASETFVNDSWQEPTALISSLNELAAAGPTTPWAADTLRQVRALASTMKGNRNDATAILDRLVKLDIESPKLADTLSDKVLARKLRKAGFALNRRLGVWQGVAGLSSPQTVDSILPKLDPQKLTDCLAKIEEITGDLSEGQAWRTYLAIDALKECVSNPSSADNRARQIAQCALARITQSPLNQEQQKFVSSEPVAALRDELRLWAAEPIGAAVLLHDLERYERTSLPSDARRLALDCQSLLVSPDEARRQLAIRVGQHYCNANFRVAVMEKLLNDLIPERNLEYSLVNDSVLGRPTHGQSLMATELAIRMLPDKKRACFALEVKGEVAARTTVDAGPARIHNDSEAYYTARKPLEIDMQGISHWPVQVEVHNESEVRGVDTPLEGVPILGQGFKWMAKSQAESSKQAANREVEQKIEAQARERFESEALQQLSGVVERMNQHVFNPLNSLMLDPQMVEAETTKERLTMRVLIGGEDQLGSHTPRPQAPANSLASVQIHESVLNNGIQRLQLEGRTFTLPELTQHIASSLNCPSPWETNPENNDVKIRFAAENPIVVRCQDDRVVLTLSIAHLSKGTHKWSNFQVRAFYKAEANGRSASLARDGVIQLPGSKGSQIALRGIFSHALSKKAPWELMPEQLLKEPKLKDAAITQFVIDDGWIGLSLGPKPPMSPTARRQRWGMK